MPPKYSAEERITVFWSRVQFPDSVGTNECWMWTGAHISTGYGNFRWHDGKNRLAHRLSYELVIGPIPRGLGLLHSCDNPTCVNPNHLIPGTQRDNVLDSAAKLRFHQGEDHYAHVATVEIVRALRDMVANGSTIKAAAKAFNLKYGTARDIVVRKNWAWLD